MRKWKINLEKDFKTWILIPTIGISMNSYAFYLGVTFLCFSILIIKD